MKITTRLKTYESLEEYEKSWEYKKRLRYHMYDECKAALESLGYDTSKSKSPQLFKGKDVWATMRKGIEKCLNNI